METVLTSPLEAEKKSDVEDGGTAALDPISPIWSIGLSGDDWVGIRLDLGDNDWDHIAGRLRASWRQIAPKKLLGLMDIAEEF